MTALPIAVPEQDQLQDKGVAIIGLCVGVFQNFLSTPVAIAAAHAASSLTGAPLAVNVTIGAATGFTITTVCAHKFLSPLFARRCAERYINGDARKAFYGCVMAGMILHTPGAVLAATGTHARLTLNEAVIVQAEAPKRLPAFTFNMGGGF